MAFVRPSYSLRAALLGAVALAALGGVAVETSVAPVDAAATTVQAPAGPASFADVVDRVKPAVVSVKVKLSDADQVDDGNFGGDAWAAGRSEEQPVLSFLPPLRHAGQ